MNNYCNKQNFFREIEKLHQRNELSKKVGADYFEPGMMEYLEQSDGHYNDSTGEFTLRFEVKGTRYDGRTEQIERTKIGDTVNIIRDEKNQFNSNNFRIVTEKNKDVGNMPAELCNVIAPMFDNETLIFNCAFISFVEHISKRSRYAKQAILFVELRGQLK